ncbi:hypothetical protein ACHAC9_23905 [Massilia sp. CMS3.1]|uniref:hypothetical protein n=1 Tax=Massilia sp. CMS3.1 TaxID=3373083 RepID=UPI003EE51FFD
MSAFASPILVGQDGSAEALERLSLGGGVGQYSEQWLQDLLFRNPGALPIHELDPHARDLIPVCMELVTGAGPADILYVTRTGKIVLVETKLWRNAEARREVVAQILDYAKELADWTYEDLSRAAATATGRGPSYLLEVARAAHPDLDEAVFVDGINRSLGTGDFLLIIAGDGIRSRAEALVSFIDRFAHLRFGLALIEVATYRCPGGAILLQPRVLAKTELLVRHVLVGAERIAVREAPEIDSETQPPNPSQRTRAAADAQWCEQFWTEYVDVLRLDDMKQPPTRPSRSTNTTLYMPPGGGMSWISVYVARAAGQAGVFLTFSRNFASAARWYEHLEEQREQIDTELPGLSWQRDADGKIWIESPAVRYESLDASDQRRAVIAHLVLYTNAMVNVFRHRLEALQRLEEDGVLGAV